MLTFILRVVFHLLLLRPFMYLWIGFNVKHGERLPRKGPAIIVCNHNSHLDTYALTTLLPINLLRKIRPVAAADYFLKNRWLAWFMLHVVRIIPVCRCNGMKKGDPFAQCHEALACGHILIIYPEGTRGDPESMTTFKKGVAWLAVQHPDVPVHPVCLGGLGKVLPKGSWIPIPMFCDVAAGAPIYATDDKDSFLNRLTADMHALAGEIKVHPWV